MNETLQKTEKRRNYTRRPYSFFKHMCNDGRKLSRAALALGGLINGFSNSRSDPNARCYLSYANFRDKLDSAHATVARNVKILLRENLIDQDKSTAHTSYKFIVQDPEEKGCICTDLFFYHTPLHVRGIQDPVFLTKAQVDVASLIITHCESVGAFKGSHRSIAHILNLSPTTVGKAIALLLRADLIYRPKEARGKNGHIKSSYVINKKLILAMRKEYDKKVSRPQAATPASAVCEPLPLDGTTTDTRSCRDSRTLEERAFDKIVDRDRYYARLQDLAWAPVRRFEKLLADDPRHEELRQRRSKLVIRLADIQVHGLPGEAEIKKQLHSIEVMISKRRSELGVSAEDLKPVFRCPLCSDTGKRPDGFFCNCFPVRR